MSLSPNQFKGWVSDPFTPKLESIGPAFPPGHPFTLKRYHTCNIDACYVAFRSKQTLETHQRFAHYPNPLTGPRQTLNEVEERAEEEVIVGEVKPETKEGKIQKKRIQMGHEFFEELKNDIGVRDES